MSKIDLSKYGIKGTTEVLYNPTYEVLYNEETRPELEGYDKGQVTELGAVNVMTGVYTGRSPKDKYIVMDKNSKDTVWWNTPEYPNDNHEMSEKTWKEVKSIALKELSGKRLFVVDGFCGTHKDTRMKVRFIMEVAWQAHFVTNMFIRPKNQEEFDQGHLAGAVCLPVETLTDGDLTVLLPDKHAPLVVYCRTGHRSAEAAQILSELGYEDITDLAGGILAWDGETVTD